MADFTEIRVRKTKKIKKAESSTSLLKRRLSQIREVLVNRHIKMLSNENKVAWKNFMENVDEMILINQWKGTKNIPDLDLEEVGKIELFQEDTVKEKSEFQLIKDGFIREAKMSIQRNNEIWYPKLSARDAELFKKDTGIDFQKYMEIPKEVEEVYDYDVKNTGKQQESVQETRSNIIPEMKSEYFERKKREFAFVGSWPERLVALWKELEGAEQATKQFEKLIQKKKKPNINDYWNFSDFNFKKNMKNNLVSLLKSYKNQVERQWKENKSMEKEMTRYIEMNKKCVLLFFNYELTQGRGKDGGAKVEELTRRAHSFSNKQNIKVQKAMKKAQLLREIQKNQYEILQLQSELELLQLRTYPILMYKHV